MSSMSATSSTSSTTLRDTKALSLVKTDALASLLDQTCNFYIFDHQFGGMPKTIISQFIEHLIRSVQNQTLEDSRDYLTSFRLSFDRKIEDLTSDLNDKQDKINTLTQDIVHLSRVFNETRAQLDETRAQLELSKSEIQSEIARHYMPSFFFSEDIETSATSKTHPAAAMASSSSKEEGKEELVDKSETHPAAAMASSSSSSKEEGKRELVDQKEMRTQIMQLQKELSIANRRIDKLMIDKHSHAKHSFKSERATEEIIRNQNLTILNLEKEISRLKNRLVQNPTIGAAAVSRSAASTPSLGIRFIKQSRHPGKFRL